MYNFGSIPFFASNNNLVEKNPSGIPLCTDLPELSGSPTPGAIMSSSVGRWRNVPDGYAYKWYIDNIFVSSDRTYEISIIDIGKYIKCIIIAANSIGRSSASTESLLITSR